jgi:hypothetical protein
MDARTLALAAQDFPISPNENFDVFFNKEQSLSDADLDGMRGGFLASNGMIIDFIFSTNTLVNGQLVNQIVLNSADPSATNVNSLRNIIQIGEGNSAFNGTFDANSLPNVLTIIQNNINDLTIQQVNLMDLSVKNMSNFVRQSVTPEMVFQSTFRIVP